MIKRFVSNWFVIRFLLSSFKNSSLIVQKLSYHYSRRCNGKSM